MKREKIGFALMLLGVIFAAPGVTLLGLIGFALGVIGLILVIS